MFLDLLCFWTLTNLVKINFGQRKLKGKSKGKLFGKKKINLVKYQLVSLHNDIITDIQILSQKTINFNSFDPQSGHNKFSFIKVCFNMSLSHYLRFRHIKFMVYFFVFVGYIIRCTDEIEGVAMYCSVFIQRNM